MAFKTVKLTTPWKLPYLDQTPDGKGVWEGYQFRINDDCDEADYWFVWGGLVRGVTRERVRVPQGNVFYITDEVHEKRFFAQGFLNQFDAICTPRRDLVHKNLIPYQEIAPWYLPAGWNALAAMAPPTKTKNLSMITSDLMYLDNHKRRFAFANQLIGHYGKELDAYGRGIRPIEDKFEAYKPYRYTIALENTAMNEYFSEKPREPFLCYGMPLYWGCPNLEDYFDPDSFVRLNLYDLQESVERIDEAIGKNFYEERFDLICQMRDRVLYQYHLFPALVRFLEQAGKADAQPRLVQLEDEPTWLKRENGPLRRFLQKSGMARTVKSWLKR